ncbi:GMC oxidoreductase [Pseudomonas sp. FP1154]|nr:GMC oxidoreductase [Pseudomonas sp. FP1154]WLG21332.1 GMC oxidoreductase [Pseudomonas sp. FP1154]
MSPPSRQRPGKPAANKVKARPRPLAPVLLRENGPRHISVVDHQLRVYGIDKLRIADASIMPRITASQHSPQSVCGQSSSGTSLKSPPSTPSISYCVR